MLLACNVSDFIEYQNLVTERMNKLIEMTSMYDQFGWVDEKDIERINELDELIMSYGVDKAE